MEYTLNEDQIKFLEAVLGGMTKEDFASLSEVRLDDEELPEVLCLIDDNVGFSLYSDLYKILYD